MRVPVHDAILKCTFEVGADYPAHQAVCEPLFFTLQTIYHYPLLYEGVKEGTKAVVFAIVEREHLRRAAKTPLETFEHCLKTSLHMYIGHRVVGSGASEYTKHGVEDSADLLVSWHH